MVVVHHEVARAVGELGDDGVGVGLGEVDVPALAVLGVFGAPPLHEQETLGRRGGLRVGEGGGGEDCEVLEHIG